MVTADRTYGNMSYHSGHGDGFCGCHEGRGDMAVVGLPLPCAQHRAYLYGYTWAENLAQKTCLLHILHLLCAYGNSI